MGDVLFDRTEHARAAEVYKRAIAMWPLAAENPRIQDRVVQAMERLRNFEQAVLREARAACANLRRRQRLGEAEPRQRCSADGRSEAGRRGADERGAASSRKRAEAAWQAQAKSDPKLREQAIEEYRQAAASYEAYPEAASEQQGSLRIQLLPGGVAVLWRKVSRRCRGRTKRSATRIRRASTSKTLRTGAIKAREAVVSALYREQVAQKLVGEPPLPQTGKLTPPVTPIALPDDVAKLQVAYDRYVTLLPDSTKIALFSYKAAEIDFRYLRFSQMRLRMADIVHKHCKDEHAVDAGNALLVSYNIEGDLEKLEEWTAKLKERGCGGGSPGRAVISRHDQEAVAAGSLQRKPSSCLRRSALPRLRRCSSSWWDKIRAATMPTKRCSTPPSHKRAIEGMAQRRKRTSGSSASIRRARSSMKRCSVRR